MEWNEIKQMQTMLIDSHLAEVDRLVARPGYGGTVDAFDAFCLRTRATRSVLVFQVHLLPDGNNDLSRPN